MQQKVKEQMLTKKPIKVDYYELSLQSDDTKIYIDFLESERNILQAADVQREYRNEEPLRELRVYNDGTSGFIRVYINKGPNDVPLIKVPFGESITFPLVTFRDNEFIKSVTIQNFNAATDIRIVGISC